MIVLRMELWPHGNEAEKETVATATIVNDGSGSPTVANYDVELFNGKRLWKKCRVENFPRKKLLGWDVLCRAMAQMLGERNGIYSKSDELAGQND